MPQTPDRKRQYAKERRLKMGDALREKQATWRDKNQDYLKSKSRQRRMTKRAMCLAAAARVRARKKGLEFSLTSSDIQSLQAVIDAGRCEISGVPFVLEGPRGPASPSFDRIDPSQGYKAGNVRVVCHALNAAMGDWGDAALFPIVSAWISRRNAIVPQLAAEVISAFMDVEAS